jgi:DNA-directed RNA polymerase subunit RPC12/RpoP
MRLRCFDCGKRFSSKKDVWRDNNNYPLCKSCFHEFVYDDLDFFDATDLDRFIDEIEQNYGRNYSLYKADTIEVDCPRCGAGTIFLKSSKNGDGTLYGEAGSEGNCSDCSAWLIFDKEGKVLKHFDSEEAA